MIITIALHPVFSSARSIKWVTLSSGGGEKFISKSLIIIIIVVLPRLEITGGPSNQPSIDPYKGGRKENGVAVNARLTLKSTVRKSVPGRSSSCNRQDLIHCLHSARLPKHLVNEITYHKEKVNIDPIPRSTYYSDGTQGWCQGGLQALHRAVHWPKGRFQEVWILAFSQASI